MNESVKRMIRDLNKYGSERKGDLSILVLSAADMIEELANKVDALEVGIPAYDWSRVRVKEYRQGQINILKIIEDNIHREIKRIREEMQGLCETYEPEDEEGEEQA